MTAFKQDTFSGIAPRIAPRLLDRAMGQTADNCLLFSGSLSSWKRPKAITNPSKSLSGTIKSIFRMNNGTQDFWLNWLTDVDCVRGPIAGDTSQRIYFTGDGEPRESNITLATSGGDFPSQYYVLGVYPPTTAPSLAVVGGAAANVTRAYVNTFVTAFGEESQPSPPVTVTGKSDGSWNLTGMDTPPANSGTIRGASYAAGFVTLTVNTTRGLRAGEQITHAAVVGMTDLNGKFKIDTVVDATHYKVALTTAQTYTSGGTWTRVAPHNTGSMTRRIYRVLTGTTGADYLFVAEIAATTTSYNDTIADTALGAAMPSTTWAMPPTDLAGLVELPNGMLAGFSKNTLCFCEPYRPHAWPTSYQQTTNRDIVGIGCYSTAVVIATKAQPWIATGSHPANVTMERINRNEPCLSKRGVASFPFGVIYPTPNGLMLIGEGGATLASEGILSKKEWKNFYPATIHAKEFQGRYFAWFDDGTGATRGFIFDKGGNGPSLVTLSQPATASYTDPETGDLYIMDDGQIKLWDADPLNNMPYDYLSKIYTNRKPINLGYAKIEADYNALDDADAANAQKAADTAANAVILATAETWPGESKTHGEMNGALWNDMMWNGSLLTGGDYPNYDARTLVFQLYALDTETNTMELKHTEYPTSNQPFSLPQGYEATDFAFRLAGNIDASPVEIAEVAEELGDV